MPTFYSLIQTHTHTHMHVRTVYAGMQHSTNTQQKDERRKTFDINNSISRNMLHVQYYHRDAVGKGEINGSLSVRMGPIFRLKNIQTSIHADRLITRRL